MNADEQHFKGTYFRKVFFLISVLENMALFSKNHFEIARQVLGYDTPTIINALPVSSEKEDGKLS